MRSKVEATGDILIRLVTWNQEAREPPSSDVLAKHLFPHHSYHVVVVGTQECENTFAKSIIVPTKLKWEALLKEALGANYDVIRSHSLQASHIIIFGHKSIVNLVSNVRSHAVPTGIAEKMGNKGGVGVSMTIGVSTFVFINAHLAAHKHATQHRIREFGRISSDMATKLWQRDDIETSDSASNAVHDDNDYVDDPIHESHLLDDGDIVPHLPELLHTKSPCNEDNRPKANPLIGAFDKVFWFGDLNFRINGTREVVDGMLANHMHNALLCNDELTMLMRFDRNFSGFVEGPLNFFPTYKFDPQSDHYDSSQKRRVPSWTDRILYKSDTTTQVLSYCSAPGIRTSDHRPVYATFKSCISFDKNKPCKTRSVHETRGATKNEGCCIS
ncbi:hypothetical protein ACHAXA_000543 [Cyclostephanos tholiformis]|uniref:Inositol polyphosphate-related phosphatase domain-containing protein n=1 Tax=Cyclostephanos tholiformis TaxID=382380 RepID=A0ABD3STD0_9STRA